MKTALVLLSLLCVPGVALADDPAAAFDELAATPTPASTPAVVAGGNPWTVIAEDPAPVISPRIGPLPSARIAVPTSRASSMAVLAKVGWHSFPGGRFDGPASELAASVALNPRSAVAIVVGGSAGYFRGETRQRDLEGGAVTSGFSGTYADADLRASIGRGPIAFYLGAGGGAQQSSGWVNYPTANLKTNHTHLDPSGHGIVGLALQGDHLFTTAELKAVSADTRLCSDCSRVGMGGTTFFVGAGTRW